MPLAKHIVIVAMIAALLCVGRPQPAHALSLCTLLLCGCTIATTPAIAMGNYNPISNTPVTATGSVTVSCQLLSGILSLVDNYTVTLSKGQSGTYMPRSMLGPNNNQLNYNLYSDPGMTTIWGDGTSPTQYVSGSITVSTAGVNVNQTANIYALIPAGQNVQVGSYSDMITATVTY